MSVKVKNRESVADVCRQYIEIKTKLEMMEQEKKRLADCLKLAITDRGQLKTVVDPEIKGRLYVVKITEVESKRLDTTLVKKFLSTEQLEVCQKSTITERLSVEATDVKSEDMQETIGTETVAAVKNAPVKKGRVKSK